MLLGNPEVRDVAIQALVHMGANVQGSLQAHLSEPNVAVEVKREIPELLVIVAGRDAREALEEALGAVSQWEFSPTWLNCEPVEVRMFVTVVFTAER
jgi:predicted FMN-binding regulatory protein PaiB